MPVQKLDGHKDSLSLLKIIKYGRMMVSPLPKEQCLASWNAELKQAKAEVKYNEPFESHL